MKCDVCLLWLVLKTGEVLVVDALKALFETFSASQIVRKNLLLSATVFISLFASLRTQVRDKACEERLIQDETEACSQETNSPAENQQKEELALTGRDEKKLEKVTEHDMLIKEKGEKPFACNIQEPISESDTATVCDKDCTAQFDVRKNTTSEKDKVSEAASENRGVSVSVASVPVAEPEIPVSVVSEQDQGTKEENTYMEETKKIKAQPLGKPSDDDAVAEVTTVFSSGSGRLYSYFSTFFSAYFKIVFRFVEVITAN